MAEVRRDRRAMVGLIRRAAGIKIGVFAPKYYPLRRLQFRVTFDHQ